MTNFERSEILSRNGARIEDIPFRVFVADNFETALLEYLATERTEDLEKEVSDLENEREQLRDTEDSLRETIRELESRETFFEMPDGTTIESPYDIRQLFAAYTDDCESVFDTVGREVCAQILAKIERTFVDIETARANFDPIPETSSILDANGAPIVKFSPGEFNARPFLSALVDSVSRLLHTTFTVGGPIKREYHNIAARYGLE